LVTATQKGVSKGREAARLGSCNRRSRAELILEADDGKPKETSSEALAELLKCSVGTPSTGPSSLRLVFAAACRSENAARAFARAGVPHVIGTTANVIDKNVRFFAGVFYGCLLRDKMTVADSFERASRALTVELSKSAPFVLLGRGTDHGVERALEPNVLARHRVSVFGDAQEGVWVDNTPPPSAAAFPLPPKMFLGRELVMQAVISSLGRDQCVCLQSEGGKRGLGSSSTLATICRYEHRRRHFGGGIFYVDLRNYVKRATRSWLGEVSSEHSLVLRQRSEGDVMPLSSPWQLVWRAISKAVRHAKIVLPPEPRSEEGLLSMFSRHFRDSLVVLDGVDALAGEESRRRVKAEHSPARSRNESDEFAEPGHLPHLSSAPEELDSPDASLPPVARGSTAPVEPVEDLVPHDDVATVRRARTLPHEPRLVTLQSMRQFIVKLCSHTSSVKVLYSVCGHPLSPKLPRSMTERVIALPPFGEHEVGSFVLQSLPTKPKNTDDIGVTADQFTSANKRPNLAIARHVSVVRLCGGRPAVLTSLCRLMALLGFHTLAPVVKLRSEVQEKLVEAAEAVSLGQRVTQLAGKLRDVDVSHGGDGSAFLTSTSGLGMIASAGSDGEAEGETDMDSSIGARGSNPSAEGYDVFFGPTTEAPIPDVATSDRQGSWGAGVRVHPVADAAAADLALRSAFGSAADPTISNIAELMMDETSAAATPSWTVQALQRYCADKSPLDDEGAMIWLDLCSSQVHGAAALQSPLEIRTSWSVFLKRFKLELSKRAPCGFRTHGFDDDDAKFLLEVLLKRCGVDGSAGLSIDVWAMWLWPWLRAALDIISENDALWALDGPQVFFPFLGAEGLNAIMSGEGVREHFGVFLVRLSSSTVGKVAVTYSNPRSGGMSSVLLVHDRGMWSVPLGDHGDIVSARDILSLLKRVDSFRYVPTVVSSGGFSLSPGIPERVGVVPKDRALLDNVHVAEYESAVISN
jgi:hypothetical protein